MNPLNSSLKMIDSRFRGNDRVGLMNQISTIKIAETLCFAMTENVPPHPNPLPPGERGKRWIPACAGIQKKNVPHFVLMFPFLVYIQEAGFGKCPPMILKSNRV